MLLLSFLDYPVVVDAGGGPGSAPGRSVGVIPVNNRPGASGHSSPWSLTQKRRPLIYAMTSQ